MKSRLLSLIFSIFAFGLFALVFLPTNASAAGACTFEVLSVDPAGSLVPLYQNSPRIVIRILKSELPKATYQFNVVYPEKADIRVIPNVNIDNSITDPSVDPYLALQLNPGYWRSGVYTVYVVANNSPRLDANSECSSGSNNTFIMPETPAHPSCSVVVRPGAIDPSTTIRYDISGLPVKSGTFAGSHNIYLNNSPLADSNFQMTQDPQAMEIKPRAVGRYILSIKNHCGYSGGLFSDNCGSSGPRLQCPLAGFEVGPPGSGKGGPINITTPPPIARGTPTTGTAAKCDYKLSIGTFEVPSPTASPKPQGIQTALGCVPTQIDHLIAAILIFVVLGVGGTVTFLLMLAGTFEMITSSGNPDELKKGQDRFYSALQGFLFIIFGLLILQIVGADILQIPGF